MPQINPPSGDWFAGQLADMRRQITSLGSVPGPGGGINYTDHSDTIVSATPAQATHPGPIVQLTVGSAGIAIVVASMYCGVTGVAAAQAGVFADLYVDGVSYQQQLIYAAISNPAASTVGFAEYLTTKYLVRGQAPGSMHTFELLYHQVGGIGQTVAKRYLEVTIPPPNYQVSFDS